MAATRRYIVKTVCAAITSFCLTGILYNGCVSWLTPWKRAKAPRASSAFDIYHFPPRPTRGMEADDYDFINILHTHLICHLEPLQQGYKLLLEVGLLELGRHTGTSFLHTQVRNRRRWEKVRGGGGTVVIKFAWQLGSSLSRLAATLPLDYSFIAALHKDH